MNEWAGAVYWGWRDTGDVPEELREEFAAADNTECQTAYSAKIKTLDQEDFALTGYPTREESAVRINSPIPEYSVETKTAAEMWRFISTTLANLVDPRCEWVHLVFVNRMPQTHFNFPHHAPQNESVMNVADGIVKFGALVSSSVVQLFSRCDWVMLKLVKGFPVN